MKHRVELLYLAIVLAVVWLVWRTTGGLIAFIVLFAALAGGRYLVRYMQIWWGFFPDRRPLIYLDGRMGVRPTVLANPIPDGYRLACLFFGSGLIDRTRTLDHGFRYEVLDPIPDALGTDCAIASLCDQRAHRIAEVARTGSRPIHLLWSGGIDSTTAAVALIKALDSADDLKRLKIFYSPASRSEYPAFFFTHIKGKISWEKIRSITPAFAGNAVVVTGELGDQLFGSSTALGLPFDLLGRPWQEALPELLAQRFASDRRAAAMTAYLSPQILRAPVAITNLYDCLWWLNFSLKWQPVSLRMMAGQTDTPPLQLRERVQHFFQTNGFQLWALRNPDKRIRGTWQTYKWPLRDYIFAFTGDANYRDTKLKQPSLRGMMQRRVARSALALTAAGQLVSQLADESLRRPLPAEQGESSDGPEVEVSIEYTVRFSRPERFDAKQEEPLWENLADDE